MIVGLMSAEPGAAESKFELEFWYAYPNLFDRVVEELVARFQRANPDVIVQPAAVGKDYEEITQKIQTRIFAGNPPALALHGFTYARYFAEQTPIVPLQEFIDRDREFDRRDFPEAMLSLGRFGGKIAALPFAVSTPILYYNADLFRKAGLDPRKPPETWAELEQAAQRLTIPSEGQHGIWFHWNITGNWLFQAMVSCAGGHMVAPDEKRVTFNEAPGIRALTFWVDLVKKGSMPRISAFAPAEASFAAGKIGMFVTSTAFLAQLERSTQGRFELGTGLFPRDTERRVPAGGNAVFVFAKDKPKQEAAWRFVKWITSAEGTTIMSKGTGYMPVRKSVLEDPKLMGRVPPGAPQAQGNDAAGGEPRPLCRARRIRSRPSTRPQRRPTSCFPVGSEPVQLGSTISTAKEASPRLPVGVAREVARWLRRRSAGADEAKGALEQSLELSPGAPAHTTIADRRSRRRMPNADAQGREPLRVVPG